MDLEKCYEAFMAIEKAFETIDTGVGSSMYFNEVLKLVCGRRSNVVPFMELERITRILELVENALKGIDNKIKDFHHFDEMLKLMSRLFSQEFTPSDFCFIREFNRYKTVKEARFEDNQNFLDLLKMVKEFPIDIESLRPTEK